MQRRLWASCSGEHGCPVSAILGATSPSPGRRCRCFSAAAAAASDANVPPPLPPLLPPPRPLVSAPGCSLRPRSYLDLLRQPGGVSQAVWDEMRQLSELRFHYRDKQAPYSYASSLAQAMQVGMGGERCSSGGRCRCRRAAGPPGRLLARHHAHPPTHTHESLLLLDQSNRSSVRCTATPTCCWAPTACPKSSTLS